MLAPAKDLRLQIQSVPDHGRKIALIGLGYIGLPVAAAFARSGAYVTGYDIDKNRVEELRAGNDRTLEVESSDLTNSNLNYHFEPSALSGSDFFIVAVPTPIDSAHRPDLGAMLSSSRMIGAILKRGDIVVYEFDRLSWHDRRRLYSGSREPFRPGCGTGLRGRILPGAH